MINYADYDKAINLAAYLNDTDSIRDNQEYVRGQADLIRDLVLWCSDPLEVDEIIIDIENKVFEQNMRLAND